ncbi:MAG: hypothetical protein CME17_06370 [Gemmatimonadetes bacterium]|nr:hypothetical protein [Gemmatimonadota bacterium]|tara:strand:+ start:409 stop:771 length:363 start_codon:yes stop_codon:yes gene_type:complete
MKYRTKSDRKLELFDRISGFLCGIMAMGIFTWILVECVTAGDPFYDGPVKAYHGCINKEVEKSQILSATEAETLNDGPCTWEEIKEQGSAGCGYPTLAIQQEEEERIEKYCRQLYLDTKQ